MRTNKPQIIETRSVSCLNSCSHPTVTLRGCFWHIQTCLTFITYPPLAGGEVHQSPQNRSLSNKFRGRLTNFVISSIPSEPRKTDIICKRFITIRIGPTTRRSFSVYRLQTWESVVVPERRIKYLIPSGL